MRKGIRFVTQLVVLSCMLCASGCSEQLGVGISVGVPIGNHGHMSVGASRWY